jgi:hypothetical protein
MKSRKLRKLQEFSFGVVGKQGALAGQLFSNYSLSLEAAP